MLNVWAHWSAKLRDAGLRAAYRVTSSVQRRAVPPACSAGARLGRAVDAAPGLEWIFHDQSWPRVQTRFRDRLLVREGIDIAADDSPQAPAGRVSIIGAGTDLAFDAEPCPQNWLYLHLDPVACPWTDYHWSFNMVRCTGFRELQFGFRYRDFYNRYRYRFEDDQLHFDIVHRGTFYNSLSRVACRVEPGICYPVEITVVGRHFSCRVGEHLLVRDCDPLGLFDHGPVAVILWEDDGQTAIRGRISDMRVRPVTGG